MESNINFSQFNTEYNHDHSIPNLWSRIRDNWYPRFEFFVPHPLNILNNVLPIIILWSLLTPSCSVITKQLGVNLPSLPQYTHYRDIVLRLVGTYLTSLVRLIKRCVAYLVVGEPQQISHYNITLCGCDSNAVWHFFLFAYAQTKEYKVYTPYFHSLFQWIIEFQWMDGGSVIMVIHNLAGFSTKWFHSTHCFMLVMNLIENLLFLCHWITCFFLTEIN